MLCGGKAVFAFPVSFVQTIERDTRSSFNLNHRFLFLLLLLLPLLLLLLSAG